MTNPCYTVRRSVARRPRLTDADHPVALVASTQSGTRRDEGTTKMRTLARMLGAVLLVVLAGCSPDSDSLIGVGGANGVEAYRR